MAGRCVRCKQRLLGQSRLLGPECETVARTEAAEFVQRKFGESLEEWFDDLDAEFAGDYDQTLAEYQTENGKSSEDLGFVVETLLNHGLWRDRRR